MSVSSLPIKPAFTPRNLLTRIGFSLANVYAFAFTFLAVSSPLPAATGGPDAYGYGWIDSDEAGGPAFEWITPSTGATVILSGNASAAGTIDLDVPWGGIYGTVVSQLRVSRNGFLSSDVTDPGGDETNDCPLPAAPSQGGGNRLYVLHDNLEIDNTTGEVLYEYLPASPHSANTCGVHVITWQNVFHASGDNTRFSFQALLFDNLDILFQFGPGNPENGLGSSTGIQNAAATIGLTVTCDAKEIPDNYAVLITPPVLTVTTEVDELDTPAGADLSLREAVRDASSGTRIEFDSSLSLRTIDLSGQGSRIDIDAKALAIQGPFLGFNLAISGGNAVRHFYVDNGAWASFGNLRIEEGFIGGLSVAGSTRVQGSSTLIACQCSWQDNFAGGNGGALHVDSSGHARLYLCDFLRNGTNLDGGAIAVRTGGTISAGKCRFWRNTAGNDGSGDAGAISLNGGDARLDFCDLALNASAGEGGAISGNVNSMLNCYGCTFDNNRAVTGGAFAATNAATVTGTPNISTFDRCTFYENVALTLGGAVYEESDTNSNLRAQLVFRYCTMIENTTGVNGGGIYVTSDGPIIIMAASVMAYNKANIAANNFAAAGIGVIDATAGDNIESGAEGNFAANGGLSNASPQFTPLGYFGGYVRTCLYLQGSIGIDQVQLETFAAGIDARGLPPGRNGGFALLSDVGAVEMGPAVAVTSTNPTGAGSIQEAIDNVENGGVVTFSGVSRIALVPDTGTTGSPSLVFPADKAVFIDGSAENTVYLDQLSFALAAGQQVALHRIHATGHQFARLLANGSRNLCSASLTLSACRLQHYFEGRDLVNIFSHGRVALLGTRLENNGMIEDIVELNGESTGATLIARDCHFACNTYVDSSFQSSVIDNNGGVALIQRCSVAGNIMVNGAASQGGIRISANQFNQVPWGYLENVTISGNRVLADNLATSDAGAVSVRPGSALRCEAEIVHCTIVGNQIEDSGGAILGTGPLANLTVTNTILAGNFPAEQEGTGTITSRGGNLSDTAPAFFGGSDLSGTDPLLTGLALGSNGTLHHLPRPGSPCIDAGLLRDAGALDGRGGVRFIDGDGLNAQESDIGAVESGRVLTVTTATDENDGGLGLGSGDSLRECLAEAPTYSAVNVDFDGALAGSTVALGTQIALNGTTADVDGLDTGITVAMNVNGIRAFGLDGVAVLSLHGLPFESVGGICRSSDDSAFTLDRCEGSKATVSTIELQQNSCGRLSRSHFHDNTTPNRIIWARANSILDIVDCALTRNASDTSGGTDGVIQVTNSGNATLKHCTLAENAVLATSVLVQNTGTCFLERCTLARNGGLVSAAGTSRVRFRESIFHNNAAAVVFGGPVENRITLGGNISELPVISFDAALGDLESRCPYLAPLADYNGDGLPEMPPLAASVVFDAETGATNPPAEVITVNTSDDQNDNPAGFFVSLREAIRDIAPGGTIVFDPSLNDSNFAIVNTGGTLTVTKDMTIDATSLPNGIDTTGGRLFSDTPGVTLAIHGMHMRNFSASGSVGGSARIENGNLVASHCTFSGNDLGSPSNGGGFSLEGSSLVAENCTFHGNRAINGSAISMNFAPSARLSFCTFADGVQAAIANGAIQVANGFLPTVYGCTFFENLAQSGTGDDVSISGTIDSLGYNAFPDAPAGTVASDSINIGGLSGAYNPFADYGGWVETYRAKPAIGVQDTLPAVALGEVPPPASDARGYPRIFGASADWGANEFGASVVDTDLDSIADWYEWFYGLDPNDAADAGENPDGDAADNLAEFLLEKDPFVIDVTAGDPATITEVGFNGFVLDLDWTGTAGHFYWFEGSNDLINFIPRPVMIEATGGSQGNLIPDDLGPFWRLRAFQCN